jgi:hypothetical protein
LGAEGDNQQLERRLVAPKTAAAGTATAAVQATHSMLSCAVLCMEHRTVLAANQLGAADRAAGCKHMHLVLLLMLCLQQQQLLAILTLSQCHTTHGVSCYLVNINMLHMCCFVVMQVDPADVVIVEGILVLHEPELRDMLNMKIYVDTGEACYNCNNNTTVTQQ